MSEPEDINEYNFYKRMNEIGEYRYRNSSDNIFVFQLIFHIEMPFQIYLGKGLKDKKGFQFLIKLHN